MKTNPEKYTVIIPVHNLDKELFEFSIQSVQNQKLRPNEVILVVKNGTESHEYLKTYDNKTDMLITVVDHNDDDGFQSQLNLGVSKCTTEWFVFLEQDDELSSIWVDNVELYSKSYPETNIFLPLIYEMDNKNNFKGFSNEAAWADGFSDEMGFLDVDVLLLSSHFNFSGMAVRTEAYNSVGKMKVNMKLTFMYEFLLRMAEYDNKPMIIPKLGYKHVNGLKGSLGDEYSSSMDPVEAKWWVKKAKQEYIHTKDRELTYHTNE